MVQVKVAALWAGCGICTSPAALQGSAFTQVKVDIIQNTFVPRTAINSCVDQIPEIDYGFIRLSMIKV